MKTKGINPFERHVEKAVLAIFAVFVLVVLLMQTGLLGGSRTVNVGGEARPLDRALEGVREQALRRQTRLQSDQVAAGIPASLPDPVEVFDRAMSTSGGPVATLTTLGSQALRLGDEGQSAVVTGLVQSGDSRFAPIRVPVPEKPISAIYEGAIDPIEVASIGASLASLLPPEQPYDARVVSIESAFDAESLRRMIEAPTEAGMLPIPAAMWQGKVELVEIEWIRQQVGPDGQWGGDVVLPALPGRPSLRTLLAKGDFQPGDFKELLDRERVERPWIRRPAFYKTIAGRPWIWPSQAVKEGESHGGDDIASKRRELAAVRQTIEETRRRLERSTTPPTRPPGNPPPPPPGGGGRGPNADATPGANRSWSDEWPTIPPHWLAQTPGGGRGGRPPENPQNPQSEQIRKRLEEQLAKLTQREQELVAELAKLGVGEGAAPLPATFDEPLGSLSSTEMKRITLWSHDLTAVPGVTYRYRAVVKVTNPLYNQSDSLHAEQRSLADAPVLISEPSQWSDPVTISPRVVYFITSATEAGGVLGASARAAAEVYEFFYGFWRKATVSMTPGDSLVGTYELPELVTFLVERDEGAAGRFIVRDRIPVDRRRTAATDAFLLDTASVVSGAAGTAQAYLREAAGRLVVRRPAGGDSPEAKRRAAFAASAGLAGTAVLQEPGGGPPGPPPGLPPGGSPPDRPGRDSDGSSD